MDELSGEDRAAIEAIIASQEDAWNRGDAETYGARALPGIVFTNVIGGYYVGRESLLALWRGIFAGLYNGSTIRQQIVAITAIGPDVAIVETVNRLSGYKHAPAGMPVIRDALWSRYQQVMVRKDDGWWIASAHNVPVHPAAAATLPADLLSV